MGRRVAFILALGCALVVAAPVPVLAQDAFEPNPSVARLAADDAYARASARSLRTAGIDAVGTIRLDSAGRVLVAGLSGGSPRVVRLEAGGGLDPTFGDAGVAELPIGWMIPGTRGLGLEVDSAGRVVVVAVRADAWSQRSAVARLLADGSLDPAFSGDGVLDPDPATGLLFRGSVRAAGSDGAQLAFAEMPSPTPHPVTGLPRRMVGFVRIAADGTIDATYGGGLAQTEPWTKKIADFAVDAAGRAVVAVQDSWYGDFDVGRLDAAGSADTAFRTAAGGSEYDGTFPATQVAFDGAGRIVGLDEMRLLRRLPDGAPDPTFSGDGFASRHEAAGFQGGAQIYADLLFRMRSDPDYDPKPVAGLLAVATGADRWAIATPGTSYDLPRRRVRGIRVQAIDPADPGAIVIATCRSPGGREQVPRGLEITPDGTTAYVLGAAFVGRVDLTTREPLPLPDLGVRWIGVPRAVDLGDGRHRVTARVRIRNASRGAAAMAYGRVAFELGVDAPPLEVPTRWAAGSWPPFRVRRGASVVRRFTWEGGDATTDLTGARLSIEVACEFPDANFADNVATSEPMTPVPVSR